MGKHWWQLYNILKEQRECFSYYSRSDLGSATEIVLCTWVTALLVWLSCNCLALITLIFTVSKPFWDLLFLHWTYKTSLINLDCRHGTLFRLSTLVSSLVAVAAVSLWVNRDSGCDSSKQWCLTKPFKGKPLKALYALAFEILLQATWIWSHFLPWYKWKWACIITVVLELTYLKEFIENTLKIWLTIFWHEELKPQKTLVQFSPIICPSHWFKEKRLSFALLSL